MELEQQLLRRNSSESLFRRPRGVCARTGSPHAAPRHCNFHERRSTRPPRLNDLSELGSLSCTLRQVARLLAHCGSDANRSLYGFSADSGNDARRFSPAPMCECSSEEARKPLQYNKRMSRLTSEKKDSGLSKEAGRQSVRFSKKKL